MNDRRKSIEAYMNQLEHKSYDTYQHCLRVSRLARGFAAYLQLSPSEQAKLVQGCYLHDLGKLFIPDAILKHEGALTTEQLVNYESTFDVSLLSKRIVLRAMH